MTIQPDQPARDPLRERVFFKAATGFSADNEFVEHCEQRLAQGDADFGDRWTRMPLDRFAHELREEAADLGAWAALADQAITLDERMDPALAESVRSMLQGIARGGARVHRQANQIARLLATAAVE